MHDVFSSEIFLLLEYFSPWSFATFLGRRILFSHYTSIPWLTQPTERTSQRINREIKKIAPLEIIPLSKSEKKKKTSFILIQHTLTFSSLIIQGKGSSHSCILITFIMVMHITIRSFLGCRLQSKPSCRQAFSSLTPFLYFLLVPENLIFLPTIWLLKALKWSYT